MTFDSLDLTAHGRINRLKFWIRSIRCSIAFIVLFGAFYIVMERSKDVSGSLTPLQAVAVAGMILTGLAATWMQTCIAIKRLHDHDKSGWWYILIVIPYVGGFIVTVYCGFVKGTRGPNRYGPDPLGVHFETIGQIFNAP